MIQDIAKRNAHTLTFWQHHGDKATEDAFNVSVRTLYRWQAAVDKTGGRLEKPSESPTKDGTAAHHTKSNGTSYP